MARNIGADGRTVYRAVITKSIDGREWTSHEGPYTEPGPARARVSFWRNRMRRNGGTAEGHIEQAHTVWTPAGEDEPEQYKSDPYGRPTYAHTDVDGDRLLVAPAVYLAHGEERPGIYFRTDHTGASIPLDHLPAFIARLQTLADTARAEAAAAEEASQ
ncbi:hypothetical protein AB0N18_02725 [Streptomyces griseoincarnatus]